MYINEILEEYSEDDGIKAKHKNQLIANVNITNLSCNVICY